MSSQGPMWGNGLVFSFCNYQMDGCNKEKIALKSKKRI